MTLEEAIPGRTYKIVDLPFCEPCDHSQENDKCSILHLTELGLVPGEEIRILQTLGQLVRIEISTGDEFVIAKKMCKQIKLEKYGA